MGKRVRRKGGFEGVVVRHGLIIPGRLKTPSEVRSLPFMLRSVSSSLFFIYFHFFFPFTYLSDVKGCSVRGKEKSKKNEQNVTTTTTLNGGGGNVPRMCGGSKRSWSAFFMAILPPSSVEITK